MIDASSPLKAKRALQALLESDGKYRSVIAAMTEGILLLDMDGIIMGCNPSAERILGIPREMIQDRDFPELGCRFFREDGSAFPDRNQPPTVTLNTGNPCRNVVMGLQKPEGGLTWVRVDSEVLSNPENRMPFAIMVSFSDISESRKQREKLEQSYNAMRELSFRLQHVREAERTSIAREIHDELGSLLTSVKFDLSWAVEKSGNRAEFDGVFQGLDAAIRSVKKICTALRPSILDDLGLFAALEWQAGEFSKKTGIRCRVDAGSSEPAVPQDVATGIFRIFQETLTNIARHAEAVNVLVKFDVSNEDISLVVTDDGKGIDLRATSKSLGILGMSERARALGGELSVRRASPSGTEVALSIPLERRASSRHP
ncbi:MAG: PAS domain-containing protein [Burkholderiales bacterium]|nr:PAS domain-containing protein [Burkholderiales bacterium]